MYEEVMQRMGALARHRDDPRHGRPIEELIKTNDTLKGYESQRLRTYCTSECMEPRRDLDELGRALLSGNLMYVKIHLANQHVLEGYEGTTETEVRSQTSQNLYALRWGPTKVPIYNLLGLFSLINPEQRTDYLKIARFLIDEFKVPVDGADLSGTTALSHCFSTKPGFDLEYAQMLYDAGGDVNHRNRYGCTVAQEICQVFLKNDREAVRKAKESFKWFLSHGGNVDIEDTDGFTVRRIVGMSIRELQVVLAEEDKRRKAKGDSCCAFCGREDLKLMRCGRCKKVVYCEPTKRNCQKPDWPRHKKDCKA